MAAADGGHGGIDSTDYFQTAAAIFSKPRLRPYFRRTYYIFFRIFAFHLTAGFAAAPRFAGGDAQGGRAVVGDKCADLCVLVLAA